MPSGKTYLLIVADSAAADALSGQRWRLHVALDIAHREALLAHYRLTLVVALAAGIVLAALAGIFVARARLASAARDHARHAPDHGQPARRARRARPVAGGVARAGHGLRCDARPAAELVQTA
jgi:hypothetical protein